MPHAYARLTVHGRALLWTGSLLVIDLVPMSPQSWVSRQCAHRWVRRCTKRAGLVWRIGHHVRIDVHSAPRRRSKKR